VCQLGESDLKFEISDERQIMPQRHREKRGRKREKTKEKREKSNTEFTEKNWRAQRKPD
jgi:hypothetical protein